MITITNDTSTLNGALQELGETMAANLTQQGVTSSASEGLTTLAGKILDIQTGGGSCYKIEFSEDSYTAIGGSATLEIFLQENYAPKVGATVSVVGSDSSLYSGITNNDGVAQVTVSNISGTVSFTCSYQGVTDTCTVTAQTYLFYDSGVTGTANTNYVKSHTGVNASVSNTGTTVSSTTSADCYYIANVLLPNDWVAEFTIVAVNYYGGIAFLNSSKTKQWNVEYDLVASPKGLKYFATNVETWVSNDYSMGNTIKLKKQGTSLEIYLNNTLISTKTIDDINGYLAWKTHRDRNRSVTFKELKIEAL